MSENVRTLAVGAANDERNLLGLTDDLRQRGPFVAAERGCRLLRHARQRYPGLDAVGAALAAPLGRAGAVGMYNVATKAPCWTALTFPWL